MDNYVVKPLSADTWDAFARLVERHNGVFGGCWCTWFHTFRRREDVHCGRQSRAQGAAGQGGSGARRIGPRRRRGSRLGPVRPSGELPNIHHRKEYEETLDKLPDYRITCIFVDKKYRRKGVTEIALSGAIDLIAEAGGGIVEGYPHDTTDGRKVSVLYNTTRSLFEAAGFDYLRPKARGTV